MTDKQVFAALLLAFVVIAFCSVWQSHSAETTAVKEIKYGRKDLIRNELVLGVISSNNELFKQVILNNGYQVELLNTRINQLERELAECKAVKIKAK